MLRLTVVRRDRTNFLGDVMQRQIFNSDRWLSGNAASRFGAVLAMAGLLVLSACSGSQKDVTQNNLPEPPGMDGVPPTLTFVSIREGTKSAKPSGFVKPGKIARVEITASEALMAPVITINGEEAEVSGKVNGWWAVREMPETEPLGEVTFTVDFQDVSGEVGTQATATTDGSALVFCIDTPIWV